MQLTQSLEDFYRDRPQPDPALLRGMLGHFNVFDMAEFAGPYARPIHYARKDYYKISLLTGRKQLTYADKVINIERHALIFSNPLIPYGWELLEEAQSGIFCLFTADFFRQFGHIGQYPVFQPGRVPVFPLTDAQQVALGGIFEEMRRELRSDYAYRHDRLRNLAFELVHQGLKLAPATPAVPPAGASADARIATLFAELLERQFPLEPAAPLRLQTPADFADQLAVHVNHLNRALKAVTGRTTSQLLGARVAQEAAFLVQYSTWPLADIAWGLGFAEPSSFVHFFRRHFQLTPRAFRQQALV
ncbi:helix-turn-helix transcriptional regulator [Hymenobacter sp. RP-2-7]|uniref:Helix-turn-helix transcriptional regulator n=1 Tax=Hymenobacter polaris TaxID=2682546 RepID=A0A7Y0AD57_9BACT|nr:helix-turn-helix transcriptional regulator [Hymenobacter polaris]NML65179.1 helix-turn-helix transcriptional regulator [Hymenobacter polaris]